MRTLTYNYNEAVNEVKDFFREKDLEWNGEKYIDKYIVTDRSADCDAFPCPRELDNWSGETSALYIEDEDLNEVFAVAYWE